MTRQNDDNDDDTDVYIYRKNVRIAYLIKINPYKT